MTFKSESITQHDFFAARLQQRLRTVRGRRYDRNNPLRSSTRVEKHGVSSLIPRTTRNARKDAVSIRLRCDLPMYLLAGGTKPLTRITGLPLRMKTERIAANSIFFSSL